MATIQEALQVAIQHHQAGRLLAAEQIYREIVAVEPRQPDALHLLGVVAQQSGNFERAADYIGRAIRINPHAPFFHNNLGETYRSLHRLNEAVDCFRRAIKIKPDYPEAHSNLGNVLRDQGKLEEAVACFRKALNLRPDYAEAHNNLGNALRDQGKLELALASYHKALKLKPDYAEVHCGLAAALKDQGKLEEALTYCRRAIELKRDNAEAHNTLGAILKEQGKLEAAVDCYRRALELKPDFANPYSNLGNIYLAQGKLDEAVACYRQALRLKPDFAGAHNNLGNALKDQGKLDEALACYRQALQCYPDFAEAHGNLGAALEEAGDLRAAEESIRAALRHNPRYAFAHYKLAELLGRKLPENELAAQRAQLQGKNLTDAERLLLHFSLANVLDARGEYAEAAGHAELGNALQLAQWRKCGEEYDPQKLNAIVGESIATCTPEFFERVRGFGLDSEAPVFIVGLPRSGTTLIEQILASHSQVTGAGELSLATDTFVDLATTGANSIDGLKNIDPDTAHRLARRHLERLVAYNPSALRIVDKMPENYLLLGMLATLFPKAKFIHCRRDLRDVAVSCWLTYFKALQWANDKQHIAANVQGYVRIMAHWRKVLPVPLLDVDYEETVADLETSARKLVAFCGLEWEPSCVEFHQAKRPVSTASLVQVRQPVYRTSVGKWQHYREALAPLLAQLEIADTNQSDEFYKHDLR